jgi:hypothetical protein
MNDIVVRARLCAAGAQQVTRGSLPQVLLLEQAAEIERLRSLVLKGEDVVMDFMPNIGRCAIQEFGRLNDFLLAAGELRKELKR